MSWRPLAIRGLDSLGRVAGGGQRLLTLIFHRVLPRPDPFYPHAPDAVRFRWCMQALREDYRVLPLAEALRQQARGELPAGAVAVTFDDGFADNVTVALPILEELRLPATFFIATDYLDGGYMFNNAVSEACRAAPAGAWDTATAELGEVEVPADPAERPTLAARLTSALKYLSPAARAQCAERLLATAGAPRPTTLMMSRDQVRELHRAGMTLGGHTGGHPILARLDAAEAAAEIRRGKAELESIIGERVSLFAYPNGQPDVDYGPRDTGLVRDAGFDAALTTAWGYADRATDRFQLPRVGSWGRDPWRFSARLALARAFSRGDGCRAAAG